MTEKEKLALKVNEIFHDIEGEKYQEKHKDIFVDEQNRWNEIAKKYISKFNSPIRILDVGTGTGFVPSIVSNYLSEKDKYVCSDISETMLKVCESNLTRKNFKCKFEFSKIDDYKINTENNSINAITINSVVHHIPDLEKFFLELNSKLKNNGVIIIGHEPNSLFYREKRLINTYLFYNTFYSFKNLAYFVLRFTKLNILLRKLFFKNIITNEIYSEINDRLKKEGYTKTELSEDEINKMVDYHSPSAGAKIDKSKGIDIFAIRDKILPNFSVEYFETYNFVSKLSNKSNFFKKMNKKLSQEYKNKGATFFVVLRKNED